MSERFSFFVPGHAEPAGSKRALPYRGRQGGHPIVVDANPNSQHWKKVVAGYALQAIASAKATTSLTFPIRGPVEVLLVFYKVRPRSHYKKDGFLFDDAPLFPVCPPDVSKLARGTEDAMSKLVYVDDRQIVSARHVKVWGDEEGVDIEVTPLAQSLVVSCGGRLCGEKESTDRP